MSFDACVGSACHSKSCVHRQVLIQVLVARARSVCPHCMCIRGARLRSLTLLCPDSVSALGSC